MVYSVHPNFAHTLCMMVAKGEEGKERKGDVKTGIERGRGSSILLQNGLS